MQKFPELASDIHHPHVQQMYTDMTQKKHYKRYVNQLLGLKWHIRIIKSILIYIVDLHNMQLHNVYFCATHDFNY